MTGQLKQALKCHQESLDINDQLHSPYDLSYLANVTALFLLHQQLGQIDQTINLSYRLI